MMRTRGNSVIPLIGLPLESFGGEILPTTLEVLKLYFFYHTIQGSTQKDSVKKVAQEVQKIWHKVRIPICAEKKIVRKLLTLLTKYRDVRRNATKKCESQLAREAHFVESVKVLFDISNQEASNLNESDINYMFLVDQRSARKIVISTVQKIISRTDRDRIQQLQCLDRDNELNELSQSLSHLSSADSTSGSSSIGNRDNSYVSLQGTPKRETKRVKSTNPVVSDEVAAALDRANVSDAKAVHIIAATASACGETNLNRVPLSVSSVRRIRCAYRSTHAANAKTQVSSDRPLTLHFDGKLLPSLTGTSAKDERLSVLVSGLEVEKLLGVPKLDRGTGQRIADACFSLINQWNLQEKIAAMSFDTTAANTGVKNGACALLEQKLQKKLLWLPCRHHILEIVCRKVFESLFGATDGSNVSLFKRFKEFWPQIDQGKFESCNDERLNNDLKNLKADVVQNILGKLNENQESIPRHDYLELLELTLVFLGAKPPRGIRFRSPGAFHHDRWMSKVLYVPQLYIFRKQFKLTVREETNCLEFGLFVTVIYVKAWSSCSNTADAPFNDLSLIRSIAEYGRISEVISKAGLAVMNRHLWYLGEELVTVSLFSNSVPTVIKERIVSRLMNENEPETGSRSLRHMAKGDLSDKTLDYFVGPASRFLFKVLELDTSFMNEEISNWDKQPSYQWAKQVVRALRSVNDYAERGVALATEFNQSRTKNEEQHQYLLQVVESHRKRFPDAKKSTIIRQLTK